MAEPMPLVEYLVLGADPHLVANECTSCGARFFDRRNACASCFGDEFRVVDVPTMGTVRDLHDRGLRRPRRGRAVRVGRRRLRRHPVRTNIINVEPDPEHVTLGMKVRLATYSLGIDGSGVEAIGFGYEPDGISTNETGGSR